MKLRNIYQLGMDFSLGLTAVLLGVLILLLVFINKAEKSESEDIPGLNPQGSLVVELFWNDALNMDVDLWVRSSWDNIPVGYSNLGGGIFNLLRDDRGSVSDISGRNMEVAYTRGMPEGEVVINAHMFAVRDVELPTMVTLVVSVQDPTTKKYNQLFKVNGTFTFAGQELTLARFNIKDSKVDVPSFNTIPEPLRLRDGPME